MNKKHDKIVKLAKQKSKITEQKVLNTITQMVKDKKNISFYSVYKKAGVSKSFVYTNEKIRNLIEDLRDKNIKVKQSKDSKDVIIESQNNKIKELKSQVRKLKKDELWQEKYKKLKKENQELKKQLEKLYAEIY